MELQAVLEKVGIKLSRMKSQLTEFPHITNNGEWLTYAGGHWTGGFWTGLLWLEAIHSSSLEAEQAALLWAKKLAVRERDNKTHDMGFIFGPSCILGYRRTGDKELERLALAGANNLLDLYVERSGLILNCGENDSPGILSRNVLVQRASLGVIWFR